MSHYTTYEGHEVPWYHWHYNGHNKTSNTLLQQHLGYAVSLQFVPNLQICQRLLDVLHMCPGMSLVNRILWLGFEGNYTLVRYYILVSITQNIRYFHMEYNKSI